MSNKTRVLNVRVVGFSAPERQMLNSIFLLSVAPARQIGYKLWNPEAGVAPDMYLLDGDSDSAVASWQATFSSTSDRTLVVGAKNQDLGVASAARPLGLKVVGAMDRLAIALNNLAKEASMHDVSGPRAGTLPTASDSRNDMSAPAAARPDVSLPRASSSSTVRQPGLSTRGPAPFSATAAGSTLTHAAGLASAAAAATAPMTATAPTASVLPQVTVKPDATVTPAEKTVPEKTVERILADSQAEKSQTEKSQDKPVIPPSSGATPLSPSALAAAVAPSAGRANLRVVPPVASPPLSASLPASARISDARMTGTMPALKNDALKTDAPKPDIAKRQEAPASAAASSATSASAQVASAATSAVAPAAEATASTAAAAQAPATAQASAAQTSAAAPASTAPVSAATPAAATLPPPAPVAPSGIPTPRHEEHNFRVLAVDDSPLMRTFLQNKLQPYGISPEFASSGEEALFKISKNHFDMIFLDVMLPGMDGYDVCKMIKKNKDNNLMKVVMLTSKDKTFDKIRGTMAGCDGYLTKPVDELKLRAIIERHTVSRK